MSTLTLSVEDCCTSGLLTQPEALGNEARDLRGLEAKIRQHETVRIAPPPFDDLSDQAARAIVSRWNRPCEGAFELLALRFPRDLVKLISGDRLKPADLTFAAEALGRSNLGWVVRRALKPLLRHDSAVVREGAIYGLQKHVDADVRADLEMLAKSDSSAGVRSAAEDALA
jgi:hypothetical protein